MTAYLWHEILTRDRLTDIIENYAQVIKERNQKTGKVKEVQVFPRYHQLDVVRKLLAEAQLPNVHMASTMDEAARKVVELANG